jgi:ribosomal protein S18 acetylase RimI-like enzyme
MDIQLIKKDESDTEFLFQLFGEIKIAELNAYAWPEQMLNQLIAMQYNGYEQTIKHEYPNADDFVIMVNSENAGRLQLDKNENGFRIINISLLPAFQKNGIGSKIIKDVLTEADLKNKPVYLEVDRTNPAFNLYKRLDFEVYDQDELKYSMRYMPQNYTETGTRNSFKIML